MNHLTIPQLAGLAGCTRARMHQLFQDGLIRFPRIDSGKQARYADTPGIRKWAVGLKERRETQADLRSRIKRPSRRRGVTVSTAFFAARDAVSKEGYAPDIDDVRKAADLLEAYLSLHDNPFSCSSIGPETALALSIIVEHARPRISARGFSCGSSKNDLRIANLRWRHGNNELLHRLKELRRSSVS